MSSYDTANPPQKIWKIWKLVKIAQLWKFVPPPYGFFCMSLCVTRLLLGLKTHFKANKYFFVFHGSPGIFWKSVSRDEWKNYQNTYKDLFYVFKSPKNGLSVLKNICLECKIISVGLLEAEICKLLSATAERGKNQYPPGALTVFGARTLKWVGKCF